MTSPKRGLLHFLVGGAAVVVLTAGMRASSGLLNPVLMAGFLALLLQPLTRRLRHHVAGGMAVALVVFAVVLGGLALVGFVGVSLRQLAGEIPGYRTRLEGIAGSITGMLAARGIDAGAYVEQALRGPEVGRTVLNFTGALASAFGNGVLTLFIFAFMLGGMWEMERRARKGARDHSPLAARFLLFSQSLRGYVGVRTVLGIVAALLNYVLLLVVGVEHALLWGVLSFLLSFVPNIGFTLSLVPPFLLALLEGGWVPAIIVLVGYQVINTVIDNIIGPRFVGRQMQISALLSFLSVIFWAWVLGPTGAVLAVPLTVLIRDLAFGPADPPDLGPKAPVTPTATTGVPGDTPKAA
ncbi:MAG TPA: AI-2E family transporter [Longimicrobium sp.]|nr:AI-2E family transporter [Longimicrobium sp.]